MTRTTTTTTTTARAFTLLEAMVVLAIAGVVSVAAMTTMSLVLRTVKATRAVIEVDTLLGQTVQFMSKDLEHLGGNGLLPQACLVVDNDSCASRDDIPACGGTDRVTVFTALPDTPVCAARAGSRVDALSFQHVQGGCCFPSQRSTTSTPPGTETVVGIAILQKPGGAFRHVRIEGIAGATCEFTATDVLDRDHYLNDADVGIHDAVAVDDFTPFIGGEATLVSMRTFFVDQQAHQLRVKNGLAAGSALLADNVHDLQIAVGHDIDDDGDIIATEFSWRASALPAADDLRPRVLPPKEVWLSVVQGQPELTRPDVVTSPLRPLANQNVAVPGQALRVGIARFLPANAQATKATVVP